ncbi:ABC transporter substrate-binding protein [Rathayibacter sp. SD072]|uniref:ABC transporter substrate-binding protein n=1 Tax=Rathayibacter sp. SD072 TaxID=2781731 RepID=UPI001A977DE5|nr:extracellular solute-binding protein [Rathayibacter sp. SD072]MBO0982627.1 extracellular solute-binding protein [Rathayibacter sp. SD072]
MKITAGIGGALALLVGATLAGCASTPQQADDGTVSGELSITFDSTYKATLDEIIANFEAEYPEVTVKADYQGGADIDKLIVTQLQAGTASDVILTFPAGDPETTGGLSVLPNAAQGYLLDLTDSEWTSEIPEAWKEGTVAYEGKVYAFPGAVQPLGAIYNQDLLDELGLTAPETFTEVLRLCADAQTAGVYAYAQGLGEVSAGPQMLSFGQTASLIYGPDPEFSQDLQDGKATFSDSKWVDQFEAYQTMSDAGCFGEGALGRTRQQGAEAVAGGQALAQVDVGAQKGAMQTVAPDTAFTVTAIPATDDGQNFVTALPGNTVSVNAATDNPTAATAFVAFLAEPEQSAIYADGFSSVPIIPNDAYEAPADLAGFAELVAAGNYAKLANLGPNQVQVVLNEAVQSMLLGNDTPQSVADKMQQAFDSGK